MVAHQPPSECPEVDGPHAKKHAPAALARAITRRRLVTVGAGLLGTAALARFNTVTAVTVTKRVAASDATATEKAAADYQCDGTDDQVQVRSALAALPTTGGILRLSSGHFDFGGSNVTINGRPDITIEGAGIDVTFVSNQTDAAYDSEPLSYTRSNHAVIRDLTISGGGSPRTTADALDFDDCDDCLVERVKIVRSRARGIVFDGKDPGADALRNVIRDCIVTGCTGAGIELLVTRDCQIIDCECAGNGSYGLFLQRHLASGQRCIGNTVTGGYFHDNGSSGIGISEGDDNVIDGARCVNNNVAGIRIRTTTGSTMTANRNQILNCVCTDTLPTKTQDYGVWLDADVAGELDGTLVLNNDLCGNRLTALRDGGANTVIRGNTCVTDNDVPVPTATATQPATKTPTATASAAPSDTPTPVPGAPLFADDFETGTLGLWSSVTNVTAQQRQKYAGTWGARATSSGSPAYAYQAIAEVSEAYFRVRFKLLGPAPSGVYLLRLRTGRGSSLVGLYVTSAGRLAYRNDAAHASASSAIAVTADAWHEVQVRALVAGAGGQVEVWYDGAPVAALSKPEDLGTTPIGRAQLGDNASGKSFDVAFDDVLVSTAFIAYSGPSGSPTQTPTNTPTGTPTSTPTGTPTNTPASTPTNTPTPTSTPTAVPPTSTPANTPTTVPPTATHTPTPVPPTPTNTATAVPPTPTNTPVPPTSTPTPRLRKTKTPR